jgi:hypothetical protein
MPREPKEYFNYTEAVGHKACQDLFVAVRYLRQFVSGHRGPPSWLISENREMDVHTTIHSLHRLAQELSEEIHK